MGQILKAWLFVDKVRGIVTTLCVLIGVGLLAWQSFAPRTVKLEPESFNLIKDATVEIRRVANNSEQLAKDTAVFKATIVEQMQTQAQLRKDNYDLLLKEWGAGPPPDGVTFDLPPNFGSLQQQALGDGRIGLHPNASGSGNLQRLRDPSVDLPETADGRGTGVPGGDSNTPSEQGERSGKVAGKQQLP